MLHLIKLCVGCDSIRDLEDWIKEKLKARKGAGESTVKATRTRNHVPGPDENIESVGKAAGTRNHTTRMLPKRAAEIIDGGSLYWVIRGQIMCRERVLDIRPFTDKDGVGRCHIVLDCKPVPVEPRPCRAFQGWRYLSAGDAPPDLDRTAPGARDMPEDLRRELRSLGLL